MRHYFFYLGGAALLSAAMLPSVHAQDTTGLPASGAPPSSVVATHPLEVRVVAAPPADFNPLTASQGANAQYAIPPAPNPAVAPRAYNAWRRAVAGAANRVAAPVLTQTNISNGPLQKVGPTVPLANLNNNNLNNNVVIATSSNWSGTSVVNSQNPFTVEAIIGEFVVPTAHQAFGSCTGGWVASSLWPGIDGNGSNDVLQAGVEVDAYCNGGTTAGFYSAWIEWFPFSETRVSSPAIHPGDLVFVQVWNTSPTNGYAYFYNYSTQASAAYQLTAPSGTNLIGNSVEWIVERPGFGGGLTTLTNYIDSAWSYGVAWNYAAMTQTYYFEGGNPPAGTLQLITMLDNTSMPISAATVESADFLWFQDSGSAY